MSNINSILDCWGNRVALNKSECNALIELHEKCNEIREDVVNSERDESERAFSLVVEACKEMEEVLNLKYDTCFKIHEWI